MCQICADLAEYDAIVDTVTARELQSVAPANTAAPSKHGRPQGNPPANTPTWPANTPTRGSERPTATSASPQAPDVPRRGVHIADQHKCNPRRGGFAFFCTKLLVGGVSRARRGFLQQTCPPVQLIWCPPQQTRLRRQQTLAANGG